MMKHSGRTEWEHADDCEATLYCGADGMHGSREWVGPIGDYPGDEMYCTCGLQQRMERFTVYGDESLIRELPGMIHHRRVKP